MTEPPHDPILDYARQSEQPDRDKGKATKRSTALLTQTIRGDHAVDRAQLSGQRHHAARRPCRGLGTAEMRQKLLDVRSQMHVALGWEYRGRRVQQGAVVYLALEGGHGFPARVEAWRRRHLNGHASRCRSICSTCRSISSPITQADPGDQGATRRADAGRRRHRHAQPRTDR